MVLTKNALTHPYIKCGDWTYGTPKVVRGDCDTRLIIGKFTSISEGVQIWLGDGGHHPDWVTLYPFGSFSEFKMEHPDKAWTTKGDVIIGNDVWIGANVWIMSGVVIGDGAYIGANAVVTRDIPDYAMAAGNPARVKRFRFNPLIILALMDIAWWNWPDSKIQDYLPLMCSNDIKLFIMEARNDIHNYPNT